MLDCTKPNDAGSMPAPSTNTTQMPTLTEFDRDRIQGDIDQLTELISRKEVMLYWETNQTTREQLEQELVDHRAELETSQSLLQ